MTACARPVVVLVAAALLAATPGCDPLAPLGRFVFDSVQREVPALTVHIVDPDRMMFDDSAGMRDAAHRSALAPGSIFRIASMTKPITSLAAMMLYEQGRLDLDAPVAQYLPEFDRVRVITGPVTKTESDATYQSRPPARPMLVRHLLTHTSGIAYAFVDARVAALDDGHKTQAELPLVHDPGEKFTYGPSTAVLGRIVERVSGQGLDAFFREHIFDPLGMTDTFYVVPADKRDRVVTVHAREHGKWVERPNPSTIQSAVRGDGGLFSTAEDYGRFLQLFLNGGRHGATRLVREDTIRAMMTNQIGSLRVTEQWPVDETLAMPFPFGAGKDTFGFGFQIAEAPTTPRMREAGSASWGGIYNTHFWIDPRRRIGVIVLMQVLPYYDPAALRVLRGFERLVYRGGD